jgi:DNA-binding response OmpR family regulator
MGSPNKDVTYEELFQVGWRREPLVTDPVVNLVNIAIERLRDKIETDPKVPKHLLNVKGVGYKFDPH